MATNKIILTVFMGFNHIQTDGKLENTLETLDNLNSQKLCLHLTQTSFFSYPSNASLSPSSFGIPNLTDMTTINSRLERIKKVVAKMRYRGIKTSLVLPVVPSLKPPLTRQKRDLLALCTRAAATGVSALWIDLSTLHPNHKWFATQLITWLTSIKKAITKAKPRLTTGLIAPAPQYLQQMGTSAFHLANALTANPQELLIAQSQTLPSDYNRTDILQIPVALSLLNAQQKSYQLEKKQPNTPQAIKIVGFVYQSSPSPFHKSTETLQLQCNLNIMYGCREILLDCFDPAGNAAGTENAYIQMLNSSRCFMNKLARFLPLTAPSVQLLQLPLLSQLPKLPPYGFASVQIITGKKTNINYHAQNHPIPVSASASTWLSLLWRMGIPAFLTTPSAIKHRVNTSTLAANRSKYSRSALRYSYQPLCYILTASAVDELDSTLLNHIFGCGCLLDSQAALALQKLKISSKLPSFTGGKIVKPINDVQMEFLSYQGFNPEHYGWRTSWQGIFNQGDCWLIKITDPNARAITTLQRYHHIPNTPGIITCDNIAQNQRSATLPYTMAPYVASQLLTIPRQQHLRALLAWIQRSKLNCFVENTPDLIPFCITIPHRKRIIITLLNISFDWAINSRIRLSWLPFKINRVRELNQFGKAIQQPNLNITEHRSYRYIQLTDDTAVAPMQTTTLLLEA